MTAFTHDVKRTSRTKNERRCKVAKFWMWLNEIKTVRAKNNAGAIVKRTYNCSRLINAKK
jgi:hypothetical protein